MKKIIIILSSLTLMTTGVNSVILANQNENFWKSDIGEKKIHWNKIEKNLLTMFDGFLDQTNENSEMLKKAKEESLKYFDYIKENNFSFEEITNNLSEISKKYESLYQTELIKFEDKNIKNSKSNILNPNSNNYSNLKKSENLDDAKAALSKFSKDLLTAQNTLSSLAVIAGVAAAGFWAAAWWFGISIPWAVAASVISASLGVASASIGFYRQKHNLDPNLLSSISWALNIRTIATAFKEIVYPVLIVAETTVTASSWAVPAAFAAIGAIAVIYGWISEFLLV